jgi:foldase protein PrsA
MNEESSNSQAALLASKTKWFKLLKSRKLILSVITIALVFGALIYFKGIFVAATINGIPVTRLSVIQELEKQGGKNTLDALITEKLIDSEAKKNGIVISNEDVDQEIKNIEASITQQGGTLEAALLQQGMTMDALKKQILVQKKIEKVLADKLQVTDEEVTKYIEDNKVELAAGKETEIKSQIAQQLKGQKLNQEASTWIASLKTESKINYYVNY